MEILVAVGHIGGSIIVLVLLGLAGLFVAGWESARNQKILLEEVSVHLGIPGDRLEDEANIQRVFRWSAERYSGELLRNRISDLCGYLRTGWSWIGNVMQALTLLGVLWFTITDNLQHAVYSWFVVGIALFFWITSVVFSLLCKVLTGRYPGQARQARKGLAEELRAGNVYSA